MNLRMSLYSEWGTDAKPFVFDEIVVGQELPTIEMQVDDDFQGMMLIARQVENPWYYKDSPWGGPITYYGCLESLPQFAFSKVWEYPFGFVQAKHDNEFIKPLPLGKKVLVKSKIADKYTRRNKGFVVTESVVVDEQGVEYLRMRAYDMVDDARIRQAAKSGFKHHIPPSAVQREQRLEQATKRKEELE